MSFARSIDNLFYDNGNPPTCAGFEFQEAWHFEQEKAPIYLYEGDFESPDDWISWLESPPTATSTGTSSRPSLSVLVIRTKPKLKHTNEPSEKESFEVQARLLQHAQDLAKIYERHGLPVAGLSSYLKNLAQHGFIPAPPTAPPGTLRFLFSDPSISWTWTYCPNTRKTRAIFLCRNIDGDDRRTTSRAILERHQDFVDQPLLLAYVCTELMGSRMAAWIADVIVPGLLKIERRTGLGTWDPGTERELPRITEQSDTFPETSERITVLSERVIDIRFRLGSLLAYIPEVRRLNRRHAARLRARLKAFRRTHAGKVNASLALSLRHSVQLDEIMGGMHMFLGVRLRKAESLFERIANQVVAVDNLRAQKMAMDSRALAESVKRDSSSMKTIAAVTMVFLPGTFVAALFAMPMFQWDAIGQQNVVSQRFWVYWAVTMPLTLLVLGFWRKYLSIKEKRERREDKASQERLAHTVEIPYNSSHA